MGERSEPAIGQPASEHESLKAIDEIQRQMARARGLKELERAVELQAEFNIALEKIKGILLNPNSTKESKQEAERDLASIRERFSFYTTDDAAKVRMDFLAQNSKEMRDFGLPAAEARLIKEEDFDEIRRIVLKYL